MNTRLRKSALLIALLMVALSVPLGVGPPHVGAQARWTVKLGTAAFAQAPLAGLLTHVGEVLEREHPGRFWVKRLVDGALARDKAGLARVATGEAHGYAASYDELVTAVPDALALSAPFAFDNERDAAAVLRGSGGTALEGALAERGLHLVAIGPCESRVLLVKSRAVSSPSDAAGLPIARGKDEAHGAFAKALGMMQVDDAEHAEEIDVRDATVSELAASGALFDARQHLTLTDHALECGVLVLSQRWIDGLPAQMQTTIKHLSRQLGDEATKAQRVARDAVLARAEAAGVEVITLDAKQRRAFVEATRDARVQLDGAPGSLARKLALAAQAR